MRLLIDDDPSYRVPVYQLESLDDFQPAATDPERIYKLSIGDGMTLAFLTRPMTSINLDIRVGLHAARRGGAKTDYLFQPLPVLRNSKSPFVMFADPTLTLKSGSRLAWYLGTPSVDPDDWMEAVIRKVMAASGAGYVLTEGSGAGGFAALRLATRFAHAVAIPRTPQTDVFRHASPDPLRETLEAAWPGYGYDELMHGYAHRFRIMDLYTDPKWNRGNLVHCVHNAGDTEHTENHLAPMLDEFGVSQHAVKALDGRVVISRPYAGDGQIGIPAHHWAGDADLALRRLKSERPLQGAAVVEGMFTKPSRAPQPRASLAAARRRTLSWHVPAYF